MGYNELKDWEGVFRDVDCVRTMMYLAKYNPARPFEELEEKLHFSKNEASKVINKLMAARMLIVENDSFTLKDSAMLALDNFIHLSKN